MKRAYFYIDDKDYKAVSSKLASSGVAFSEFARQAVQEKMDREQIVGQVVVMRNELAGLVNDFRSEIARTRKDLMDDSQRGLELMRQDIGKSMKKNEELNKTFVMMLGGQASTEQASPVSMKGLGGQGRICVEPTIRL